MIEEKRSKPLVDFFKGLNYLILKIIDIVMLFSPLGVFALMAALMVEIPYFSTLGALGVYGITVLAGLALLVVAFYPTLLYLFANVKPSRFFKAISPAQLLAFSTSSSAATLPVTLERVRSAEHTSALQSLMRISYGVFWLKKTTEAPFILTLQIPST